MGVFGIGHSFFLIYLCKMLSFAICFCIMWEAKVYLTLKKRIKLVNRDEKIFIFLAFGHWNSALQRMGREQWHGSRDWGTGICHRGTGISVKYPDLGCPGDD